MTQLLHNGKVIEFQKTKDRSGLDISVGSYVDVPDGADNDSWMYGFTGRIVDVYDDGSICVKDQEDDCFDMEANRVNLAD